MTEMTDYTIADGRVTSPGKFQGEPRWVPYFYALDDELQVEDGACVVCRAFQLTPEERRQFPELKTTFAVVLAETDDGFVTGHTFATDYELGVFVAECELDAEECSDEHD